MAKTLLKLFAVVLLVLTAPVMLAAMLIVKLTSPGPALYSQVRLGRFGRPFTIYKIRSMRNNCEAQSGPRWCVTGDPRVTPFGWFLRKSHIDELPQLWNVLRGDLSLVGPRPERPMIVADLETKLPDYRERMSVKPGITGLAQVQLPPDETLECVRRKLQFDIQYVAGVSAWLDLRIMLSMTFNTAPKISPFRELKRRIKDTAFFGLRALWR